MTTADVLAASSLVVAFVALAVSALAIRRDRASLVVRDGDAAAGHAYLTVANVGLRPTRITRVLIRPHRWRPWERPMDLTLLATLLIGTDLSAVVFPVVLEPAGEVVLAYPTFVHDRFTGALGVEDASGRLYWPSSRRPRHYRAVDLGSLFR
jgi:hypothetical protein